ncbi:MAG TPA: three-Cys-motif partner protein TcmP [Oscillatoriales cyanobacterium M59_W2019_021]|nr:MAG: three-Cys-motif partner protein TcmP [Cyanobacteria bacterium J055]HIK31619.1 three-Cys-motif partner protein TcmP [Oscillatoriales cyanobacterium M4454_W2019_049]HIK50795.1 three-Cys-motif partner protein TcmP [Oscillatoriales cyanobacterium M59_W2019_021]
MSRFGSEGEDIIGRWSEEKLDLLSKYLKAYSDIMNKQKKSWLKAYYYIDAFAGSVRPRAKEDERRYIDGSPLRALQTEPKFDGYWFVDVSPRRIERVRDLREEFPNRVIYVRQGNCNDVLCNEIVPQLPYASKQRAFVFLDPYGLQVDWDTVSELANTRTCDVFVNFSVMGVTRLLPREQKPERDVVEQLNKVMGGTDWITQIYQQPSVTQLDLFGNLAEQTLSRDTLKAEWLASLYTEQLRSLFPYVSRPVLMRNSTNSVLYALCLASHNQTATKITNEIFNRHERLKS